MRMRTVGLLVSLLLSSSISSATVAHRYSQKIQKLLSLSEEKYSIAKVSTLPAAPQVGDPVSFAIELSTEFQGPSDIDPILVTVLNGAPIKVFHRGGGMWVTESTIVSVEGINNFEVNLFIQDKRVSEDVSKQLLELSAEIDNLNRQINQELDPAKKAYLISQRDLKALFKTDLETSLESLKRAVSSKTHAFKVVQGSLPPNYPSLVSCLPAYGDMSGGVALTVQTSNLQNISKLMIGGIEIPSSAYTVTGNTLTFNSPILTEGLKDITVETLYNGNTANILLKNAFFAIEVQSGGGPSLPAYPVAFAGSPKSTQADIPVTLDGSGSYSPDETALTYLWSVISKPDDAQATDGVFSDNTVVNPSFSASVPGNYVVALTVSNGIKQSTPSLTVVTVGSKFPITITPAQITGSVGPDGIYVGMFKACNNLTQEIRYQIYDANRIVLSSGSKNGGIPKKTCQNFHFSVVNFGNTTLSFDVPFIVQHPTAYTKLIHMEIAPVTVPGLSFLVSYDSMQWMGERDMEVLSSYSHVPLFGTFDEASITPIILKNSTANDISISNPPVISHLNGSSNVFSIDFPPQGLVVPANGQLLVDVVVSPGTFGAGESAEALLTWEVQSGTAPRTLMLQAHKLPAPASQTFTVDFGEYELGDYVLREYLRIPSDFFTDLPNFTMASNLNVTSNASGFFSIDTFEWPGSLIVGNNDYIQSRGMDIPGRFTDPTLGTRSASVQFKLKGYLTPFTYNCSITIIPAGTK